MASSSYPYSAGRVSVLLGSLLSDAEIERLSSLGYAAALKLLGERGFGAGAAAKTSGDALCDAELADCWKMVDELTPNKTLSDLFKLEVDAINLKLLFKQKLLGAPLESELSPGAFDPALLRKCVESANYPALGESLAAGLRGAEREWKTAKGDVGALSAAVDNAIYGYIFATLAQQKSALCERYFKAKVDFTNIVSLLRARALSWRAVKLENMLIAGGDIPLRQFTAAVELPGEALYAALRLNELGETNEALKAALDAYLKTGDPAAANAVLQRRLFAIVEAERNDSFGVGPVAYYLLRRLTTCTRVRVVLAASR